MRPSLTLPKHFWFVNRMGAPCVVNLTCTQLLFLWSPYLHPGCGCGLNVFPLTGLVARLFRHSCSCSLPVKHESLLCCWRCYTYHRNIRSCSTPSDIPSEGTCNLPTRWPGIGGRDVPVLCVPSGVKTRCTPHLPATSENRCTSTSQVYRGLCDLWWKAANSFNVIGDNSVFDE